jgi:hypothetical protein
MQNWVGSLKNLLPQNHCARIGHINMKAFWYNVDSELLASWSPGVGRGHNREKHIYRPWNVQVHLRNVPYHSVQEANRTVQETNRTVQEVYRTVQEPYRTVQKAYRTVQKAYRTVQKAYRTVQEPYRTVQKAYRTVQSVQDNQTPPPKANRTVQIIRWPLWRRT